MARTYRNPRYFQAPTVKGRNRIHDKDVLWDYDRVHRKSSDGRVILGEPEAGKYAKTATARASRRGAKVEIESQIGEMAEAEVAAIEEMWAIEDDVMGDMLGASNSFFLPHYEIVVTWDNKARCDCGFEEARESYGDAISAALHHEPYCLIDATYDGPWDCDYEWDSWEVGELWHSGR